MFFIDITEWVANWFWDTVYEILITIIDKILYSLVGFFYKVFIMLGTMDIFGGTGSGNEKAMEMFNLFTNRLYGVIGIIMVFVLAYQLIIYIVDPDKGAKDSTKLVKNLVKAIVIVTLLPLAFHYMALVQKHVLEENVIWSIVLGTNGQTSDNAVQAGNAMASMVYMTMFHPIGTDYNDFYDNNSQLKPYRDACAPYAEYYGESTSGSDFQKHGELMSETSLSHWARWGLSGQMFFGTIGGVIGGIVGGIVDLASWIGSWFTEDESMTSCQMYWSILYSADGGAESSDDNPSNMDGYDLSTTKKLGNSNNASALTMSLGLVDEIREEGTMEYMILAPIAGAILVFMLVGYSLDMAYRAFKLAFLELISPIPVLLGVIPKQEGIFNKWKDLLLKTYLDVFVRTFVMAFTVFMIQLVPTFIDAIFLEAFRDMEGDALLKCVTTIFLVLGLVRFAKELPDMIKDLAKSGSGLLKDINLNPMNSMKEAAKPIGALAGGIAGGAASMKNSLANNKRQKIFQRGADGKISTAGALGRIGHNISRAGGAAMSGMAGATVGGKNGWKEGLKRGSLTNSVKEASKFTNTKGRQISNYKSAMAQLVKGDMSAKDFLGMVTDGRSAKFGAAWNNIGYQSEEMLRAGKNYRSGANTVKNMTAGADTAKTNIKSDASAAIGGITSTKTRAKRQTEDLAAKAQAGITKTGRATIGSETFTGSMDDVKSQARTNASKIVSDDELNAVTKNVQVENGQYKYTVGDKTFTASSLGEIGNVENQIREELAAQKVEAAFTGEVSTKFGDTVITGSSTAEVMAKIESEKAERYSAIEASTEKFVYEFNGEHLEADTREAAVKAIKDKSESMQRDEDVKAIVKYMNQEGGVENVRRYAEQARVIEVSESDVLTDAQKESKTKKLAEVVQAPENQAQMEQLAKELGLKVEQMTDMRSVSAAMASKEFADKLASADDEVKNATAKMVRAMQEAQSAVAKSITEAQIATEGATYDWLGRQEDALNSNKGPGPKDGNK